MKILVAEDDVLWQRVLEKALIKWHFEPVMVKSGTEALAILKAHDAPRLAVLDWMMPEMEGVDVCRQVRSAAGIKQPYIFLLTSKERKQDVVEGLAAGADDYLTKPFDHEELHVRLKAGERIVKLQMDLEDRVNALEQALSQVRQLNGLLPICSYCKKIRDDKSYWQQVEQYIAEHSGATFSHGICPDCYEKHYLPELEALKKKASIMP